MTIVLLSIRTTRLMLIALVLMISGCISTGPAASVQLLGEWESTVAGIRMVSQYSEASMSVDGYAPLTYSLEGTELVINGDRNTLRQISFPAAGEMVQLDPITGTEHRFTRKSQ